ncbi:MAG: endonuclease III [Clostridia bacterium]|nr:endonuclease III [Clostridia bacterium]
MRKSEAIMDELIKLYGGLDNFLEFNTPFELVIAVMLSAQCTDERVNKVTKEMYKKVNTPKGFAKMKVEDIEKMISSISYYHTKAKHIKECSTQIMENYGGQVPNNMKDLMTLSGIGRKSANVIMLEAFNDCQGIAVDTHVFRISKRLGLSDKNEPQKVEQDLLKLYPKKYWPLVNHILISHGRNVCKAQSPDCKNCTISQYCKFYKND